MTASLAPHSLIAGGTGMLRGVALHLAAKGHLVSVIARRAEGLSQLAGEAASLPGRIHPMMLDYADDEMLRSELNRAIAAFGPLALVVTWVRETAPWALDTVAACADAGAGEAATGRCRLFRVLGSAAADPAIDRRGKGARFKRLEGIDYREIILGFRIEDDQSRWNTKEEIAAGVIDAIERDAPETVVGVVRPWEMNPRLRR